MKCQNAQTRVRQRQALRYHAQSSNHKKTKRRTKLAPTMPITPGSSSITMYLNKLVLKAALLTLRSNSLCERDSVVFHPHKSSEAMRMRRWCPIYQLDAHSTSYASISSIPYIIRCAAYHTHISYPSSNQKSAFGFRDTVCKPITSDICIHAPAKHCSHFTSSSLHRVDVQNKRHTHRPTRRGERKAHRPTLSVPH